MTNLSKGRHALAISDRSGMQFPYNEMVREWNGAFVHISEYEPKPRKCSYSLLERILMPLFEEKEVITLEDIIKKSGKKKNTVLCYLSELTKHKLILKEKNLKDDKRTKLYKKVLF